MIDATHDYYVLCIYNTNAETLQQLFRPEGKSFFLKAGGCILSTPAEENETDAIDLHAQKNMKALLQTAEIGGLLPHWRLTLVPRRAAEFFLPNSENGIDEDAFMAVMMENGATASRLYSMMIQLLANIHDVMIKS